MAKADERHEWRVDDRCIGCGASVSVAPELIVWSGERVRFARQPSSAAEEDDAWRAALVCPTGSIKRYGGGSPLLDGLIDTVNPAAQVFTSAQIQRLTPLKNAVCEVLASWKSA